MERKDSTMEKKHFCNQSKDNGGGEFHVWNGTPWFKEALHALKEKYPERHYYDLAAILHFKIEKIKERTDFKGQCSECGKPEFDDERDEVCEDCREALISEADWEETIKWELRHI